MELWPRPTKQKVGKVQGLLEDPLIFHWFNNFLTALDDKKFQDIDFYEEDKRQWTRLTRKFIMNTSPKHVTYCLLEAIEDLANDQWRDFELPVIDKDRKKDLKAIKIAGKLPITEVARNYGLKVRGTMAICPFHADKDPSLSFSDEKGVFNCFGCGVKGDIFTFIRLMEDLMNG